MPIADVLQHDRVDVRSGTPSIIRDAASLPATLGRIGSLEVRLATTAEEIRLAQRLRYEVFCEERGAQLGPASTRSRRDVDEYDRLCDHLLVVDHAPAHPLRRREPAVVGTYRLLRQARAERRSGFYSAREFHIQPIIDAHPELNFLELGRSCVLRAYRSKRTVELLWHGIWRYVLHFRVDVMFGCASFEGTDLQRLALPLSFLHHHAAAPEEWRARPLADRRTPTDLLAKDAVDPKAAMRELPPLIKGYLRVGAGFGDGAVVDHRFGTTDVLVVMPVAAINRRYIDHFGPTANRHAA